MVYTIRGHVWRKIACVGLSAALASLSAAPVALAAPAGGWSAPTSEQSVADNVVTVGSHKSATAMAEILGLNGTSISTVQYTPTTLAQACANNRLGVYGSSANVQANPYIANDFYNFYAAENGKTSSADVLAKGTDGSFAEYLANSTDEKEYGMDIVVGTGGSPGGDSSMTMNHDTTTSVNYTTWGTGLKIPSQPYNKVLRIRTWTNNPGLAGTLNSDENEYVSSTYYRAGDETYDPIAVQYNENTGSYGFNYYIDDENKLARAAKLVMQQRSSKTTRYGDPLDIANAYELYAKATKWYVLSKLAENPSAKKTVAVVAHADAANKRFRLVKLVSEGGVADKGAMGTMGVAESTQDTVNDIAASVAPSATAGSLSVYATPEQVAKADVVLCLPPVAQSFDSSAASVRSVFSDAGYTADLPIIIDNALPTGTFETNAAFGSSVESVLLTGLVQGCIYPEWVNPVNMMTYWSSELFHLSEGALKPFVSSELSATTLPSGISLSDSSYDAACVASVRTILNEGAAYYYAHKADIDKAHPLLVSSDALDDAFGYGTGNVKVNAPDGTSVKVYDEYGLLVTQNADGTYTLDNEDAGTVVVSRDGFRDKPVEATGASGTVNVVESDMVAVKHVAITVPEGASMTVRGADNLKVKASSDGSYVLDADAVATVTVSMEGYVDTVISIPAKTTKLDISEADLTPTSQDVTIVVPDGAKLTVKDAAGKAVKPKGGNIYTLFDRAKYTLVVKLDGFAEYTTKITTGEKTRFSVYRANLKPTSTLTLDVATVKASSIGKEDSKLVKTLTLGTSVKKIATKAFAKCPKLTALTIKSTKLTKKKVKNSLKGSKVKTVRVPAAKKKAYTKIFTKANCGKKVTVK